MNELRIAQSRAVDANKRKTDFLRFISPLSSLDKFHFFHFDI